MTSPPLSASLRTIPAPPFLVPAVLDALARSNQYAAITTVVPGEADPYCALAARNLDATILTSDSDLLVYDIGPKASVMFFNQISTSPGEAVLDTVLQANVFVTAAIAKRLQLPNLHRLAYEIKADPTVSFAEALRRAKSPVKDDALFRAFGE
ncbi:MAG: hypothetical protein L6R39_003434, partial [Caloplaca ligustica]